MNGNQYVDMFATKGIEYLLVIGFLLTLIIFWKFLNRPSVRSGTDTSSPVPGPHPWFRIAEGVFFHQGHSWAAPAENEMIRVGIDDFAQKLIGPVDAVETPSVGQSLEQGDIGWRFTVGLKTIPVLSPVKGTIVAVNEEVRKHPELINEDPYGKGWLMKVIPSKKQSPLTNLLSGRLATFWMEEAVSSLRQRMEGELGPVLQDGGLPVSGFAKELSPEKWEEIAAEYFLTE